MAVDEVIMKFRKGVIFMVLYLGSIKICKLSDTTGYTYGKRVFQRKDSDISDMWKASRYFICCSCILDDILEK
jgi:hypothetical protein